MAITLAEPREHRQLKSIERVTKRRIPIETLPTSADLRERRLELTRALLHETLVVADYEHFRVVVDSLTDDFDVVQVALAAVQAGPRSHQRGARRRRGHPGRAVRPGNARGKGRGTGRQSARGPRRPRTSASRPGSGETARVFVSAGRKAGVRPQDLVGAIANETSLSGKDIGTIEITDNFSLVEIPAAAMSEVVTALKGTRIKGNRVKAKRDASRR